MQLKNTTDPLPLDVVAIIYRAAVAFHLPPPGCEPPTPAAVVETANAGAPHVQKLMSNMVLVVQEAGAAASFWYYYYKGSD